MTHDSIYTNDIHHTGFIFDDTVASVFSDMIQRSVPGYAQTLQMIELLAHQYAQDHSNLYDLGCSLGAASMALQRGSAGKDCSIIGIDNSPAMIQRCQAQLQAKNIQLYCQDISQSNINNASVVVLNFVLQFIDPLERLELLQKIHAGLKPGGVFILSEKIAFTDQQENQRQIALHESFKRAQGYSELEISRKRAALEHVLIPETQEHHHHRLQQAGFSSSHTWFQCFNFISIIAYK